MNNKMCLSKYKRYRIATLHTRKVSFEEIAARVSVPLDKVKEVVNAKTKKS